MPPKKPWRDADLDEILHVAYIASGKWEKYWKGPIGLALKENAANALFFCKIAIQEPFGNNITVQSRTHPFACPFQSQLSAVSTEAMPIGL